ncbi:sphingomyelin phosphodiesterase 5-like [Lemur catta]|uniref:sphingomyelin phosphodiesterase 5-like n=1 Tax=Lemur catta TaxID=9447 RepID=UPI001E269AD0|nr:sphingomyelin phosphodiesterase 5-like [Lemur catta]
MQSPPDWPPTPDALRPSPFPHPLLHALHSLGRVLLFPAYWALDQLLGCCAPATRAARLGWLRAAAGGWAALLLLLLLAWRRPFCYRPAPPCWVPPAPWRPPAEQVRCFVFLSANLCLLPDGLARFNNLSHSQRRAETIGAALLAGLRPALYRTTDCSQPWPRAQRGVVVAAVPADLDFVCLQEVFDLRAAHCLVGRLAPNMGPVLYDVGTLGLQPGPHLKLLGSGLLLASRYPLLRATFHCFPNARGDDALPSKGLLSAQAQLGHLDGRRIVGFLHCTHLHAPPGTMLSTRKLHHSVASSPEMLWRALEQEKGRHLYLASPPFGRSWTKSWRGLRVDYITYRGVPRGPLNPEVEQVTFSKALAVLTDHLAMSLQLRVSVAS